MAQFNGDPPRFCCDMSEIKPALTSKEWADVLFDHHEPMYAVEMAINRPELVPIR